MQNKGLFLLKMLKILSLWVCFCYFFSLRGPGSVSKPGIHPAECGLSYLLFISSLIQTQSCCCFLVFLFMWTVHTISQSSLTEFFLSFWAARILWAVIGKINKVLKRKYFDLDTNPHILVVWLFFLVNLVITGAHLGQVEVDELMTILSISNRCF